ARIRALRHLYHRASAVLRILDKANIVDRTAEFANVLGIDFTSVLTRGSQFRVESLMARIAHPELFILSSPTRDQVAQQRAAECLPLVLEPKSRYYTDPVVVLDFQSLYPSIMIAYNYCFSTCLGSLDNASSFGHAGAGDGSTERRFGFTSIAVPPGLLSTLGHQNITVSPNGILFVKQSVRKGLLGRMLEEILESRVMIKESIDLWSKDDEALHKKLDAWQLGLKLIANVTYGYTGASFSGRMPCVEVADAIVQTGRETLENAIRFIQSRHNMWGAEVVYGDTDSMFIHFPGKTRQTAFRLGHEIADAITKLNPRPVRLKFEKVYQPCVLLTKKRYAGWMYTSVDQTEPQLDVKGMELVRRDGCGIQQSILEGAMDMLFRENDLSLVKSFVTAQINKVLRHDVPVDEFIIAKEVRLGTYSGRTLPAHAKVARDMLHSKQGDPLHGERVSYIVISNGARTRLNDQVIPPLLLLKRPGLRLDHQYYIEKQIIPALDRVFGLVGVDVRAWINDMPRHLRNSIYDAFSDTSGSDTEDDTAVSGVSDRNQSFSSCKSLGRPAYGNIEYATAAKRSSTRTLDKFYHKRSCMLCQQVIAAMPPSPGRSTTAARPPPGIRICERCWLDSAATAAQVGAIYRDVGSAYNAAIYTCINCVGGHRTSALQAVEACECVDCPVLFQRKSLKRRYQSWSKAASALDSW
ncbi:DNA polymerase zeta, partial [Coemansia sp. IMI 209127]